MFKPKGYDSTREYGDFESLPTGNYICTVKKVEEGISKAGREKLMIYLDIAEGEYAGFFGEQYNRDTREDKKWPCVVHQLSTDEEGNCSRGLKTFITCVAHSNPGFDPERIWGPNFCTFFRGKEVGAQFRQEEYINQIIGYVCENGDITPMEIIGNDNFDGIVDAFGANMVSIRKYVDELHNVIAYQTGTGDTVYVRMAEEDGPRLRVAEDLEPQMPD
jgi:hypothetical protein